MKSLAAILAFAMAAAFARVEAADDGTVAQHRVSPQGYFEITADPGVRRGSPAWATAARPSAQPVKVLLIGDSLSFGTFGETLEGLLRRQYGAANICVYASCGSSPEHWIKDGPLFMTPCGYRESTPRGTWKEDFSKGQRPRPVPTPKIPDILAKFSPHTVVVQLGTNWMDGLSSASVEHSEKYKGYVRQFIKELRVGSSPPKRIVWILPPDASKYSQGVKEMVDRWITECAREAGFSTIVSRRITGTYQPGKTGGDGVHYGDSAAEQWAKMVNWMLYAYGPD